MRLLRFLIPFLLVSVSGFGASEPVEGLLKTLNSDASETKRIEALAKLERNAVVDARQVLRSICDTSPAIRAAAVRIGSSMAGTDPELELRLIALANDRSPLVQAQMLKSLPLFPSKRAAAAFKKLMAASLQSSDAQVKALAESLKSTP